MSFLHDMDLPAPRRLSCGILILTEQQELLLCHVTGQDHWDLPKGGAHEGESPLQAALRETREETGLDLAAEALRELGRFDYRPKKDLHLFATLMPRFDVASLRCESQFSQYATGTAPARDGRLRLGALRARGRAVHAQDDGRAARPAEPATCAGRTDRRIAGGAGGLTPPRGGHNRRMPSAAQTIAVIDFETTGISPGQGARATEIAAVLVRGGRIVDRYASLMHSGAWVSPFIEQLTGISNAMLQDAPPAAQVMREVLPLHAGPAAGGPQRRLRPRLLAGRGAARRSGEPTRRTSSPAPCCCRGGCTRRLPTTAWARWPRCTSCPALGRAHRALADAEVTAHLLLQIQHDVSERFGEELGVQKVDHGLLMALQRGDARALQRCVARYGRAEATAP